MSYFKMSNNIFNLGLKEKELYCYTYLNSIYSGIKGNCGDWIAVKQSTVARKCNIRTEQTVGRIINSLIKKGFITSAVRRKDSLNGTLGTYCYMLKKQSSENGFFFVDRKIFDFNLKPKQFMVYLFMCRAFSFDVGFSWNSYNDISFVTGIERSEVVKTVKELITIGLIARQNAKSRLNRRVYVDNHYFIVKFEKGTIFKKPQKCSQKRRAPSRQRKALINNSYTYCNTRKRKSQGVLIEYDSSYELNPDFLILNNISSGLLEAKIPKSRKKSYNEFQREAIMALVLNFTQPKFNNL